MSKIILNLRTIGIGFLVEPFFKHDFFNTWPGLFIGWGYVYSILDIRCVHLYGNDVEATGVLCGGLGMELCGGPIIYLFVGPITGMFYWIHESGFKYDY